MKHVCIFGLGDDIGEHITQVQNNTHFHLIGIYDNNTLIANKIANKYGIKCFTHPMDAIGQSDIVDFANSHILDIENAKLAIKCNKDLLLASRFLKNMSSVQELININSEAGVDVFISQPDFFNPIIKEALDYTSAATFVDIRRGIQTTGSASSKEALLNLLYQEIIIATAFVNANCKRINVVSNNMEIEKSNLINARLEFDNAAVVSININSIALKKYRKMDVYKSDSVVNIDVEKGEFRAMYKETNKELYKSFEKYDYHNYIQKSFEAFDNFNDSSLRVFNLYDASKVLNILGRIEGKLADYAM